MKFTKQIFRIKKIKHMLLGGIIMFCAPMALSAKIMLPSVISDNMVLQQESEVEIWGWSTKSAEQILVWGSWGSDTLSTKVYQGRWSLKLPTPKSGGPYTLHIMGHETIKIKNVLVGEVWMCSGQSNMEMPMDSLSPGFAGVIDYKRKIKEAHYPSVRFFQVSRRTSNHPQDSCEGRWIVCTPEEAKGFSAVAYNFGKTIHEDLKVPVGLLHASWGGTNIEPWIPEELINENPIYKEELDSLEAYAWWPKDAGLTYNAMINPITRFTIAGVIWYQGESNRFFPKTYASLMPLMIDAWRKKWDIDFPFYYVQIAPFDYNNEHMAPLVRESQSRSVTHHKTGMIVIHDLVDDIKNIHPRQKTEVGKRLAAMALVKTYNKTGYNIDYPSFSSMTLVGNKAEIRFNHAYNGLMSKGEITEFQIAGADRIFYPAKAKINKDGVVVWSKKVKRPIAVRYGFSNTSIPKLYGKNGLPVDIFRTDDWEVPMHKIKRVE
ncbi:sialate O-acetylesterase [Tamlana sp. 2201CG12-4]|uniref:sialate O-acetylesterase n=1 Tax=Tamlana sp. 2201CG12-4 TaxID=3112582 RepID=UPI002DB83E26|nr:sialate O-acetylesterase [Tamlana sp. 2201CG12-4]MEC3907880.1 sialate O-acetylesterase [Tamlana sp. 2201CG12-4]